MEEKTLGNYGGPFGDAVNVVDPESEMDSDQGNLIFEDTAQMTNTSLKAIVVFTTVAADPVTVSAKTQWGNGVGPTPTVNHTGAGRYTVTFDATFTDALGNVETLSIFSPEARAISSDVADDCHAAVLTYTANTITLKTESVLTNLADTGNNSGNPFEVHLYIR